MKIITCNVNGIRSACSKGLWSWLEQQDADMICFQELKAHEAVIPDEILNAKNYHVYLNPAVKPGYSGVAILSRKPAERVIKGMRWKELDHEGRYIQIDIGNLSVISIYFPSGTSGDHRQEIKYAFLDRIEKHLVKLNKSGRDFIFCGDFNIAHKEIDIKNWRGNLKNSGFLPEERAWLDKLFNELKFVDAFRVVNQEADQYTWWSNRGQAYAKNVGWRIDYHVISSNLRSKVKDAEIYKEQKFSDHAPLIISYDYEF